MTVLHEARIVRAEAAGQARPLPLPLLEEGAARVLLREKAEALEEAAEIRALAKADAEALILRAKTEAADVSRAAAEEARQAEEAKLAALYLRMRHEDETRAERDLDRAVGLAVVLAERLLGEALTIDPSRIAPLARQALSEARGARRAAIFANPLDAKALQHHLAEVGLPEGSVEVKADPELGLGSLRIITNLGTLDAQLRPQLERLARALGDALRRG